MVPRKGQGKPKGKQLVPKPARAPLKRAPAEISSYEDEDEGFDCFKAEMTTPYLKETLTPF